MKKESSLSQAFIEMRNNAEKRLIERLPDYADGFPKQSEMHQIIRQLAFHKAELEVQWKTLFQSHQELEEELKNYIKIYDLARIGYLTIRRDGLILQYNMTVMKLLARESAALKESQFRNFITGHDLPVFNAFFEALFARHESELCEITLFSAGIEIPVRIAGSASDNGRECQLIMQDITGERLIETLTPESGKIARRLATLRRIDEPICAFEPVRKSGSTGIANTSGTSGASLALAERKRMEEEKEKLQLMLINARKMETISRIAGGIGHDFNNKLQTILGNTDLLIAGGALESNAAENLLEIRNAVIECAGLTGQLLSFAKKRVAVPKVLDLNMELSRLLQSVRNVAGTHITIDFRPAADLWTVKMDPVQFEEIMHHLMKNAFEAIGTTGTVTVKTGNRVMQGEFPVLAAKAASRDYIVLEITDTGHGMEKETLEELYEPFFTTKKNAHGLGLSTVNGIVEQNNGFMTAESVPDESTIFRIFLPRFEMQHAIEQQSAAREGVPGGNETILLVDDEEAIRRITRKFLESFGYRVIAPQNAEEALMMATECRETIDLLITDMIMPGMNGRELAEAIQKIMPCMKTLFISGYSADVFSNDEEELRGIHFLEKPFFRVTLSQKVREVLDSGREEPNSLQG